MMLNKKEGILFMLISSLSFVSAQYGGPVEGLRTLLQGLKDMLAVILTFASDIFFNVNQIEDFLFAKILITLLIFFVIYTVLKKNKMFNDKISLVISIIISILAVRFIPDNEFINGILLPYGVLGIAITVFLPYLIYFFFVHQSVKGSITRRLAWMVFGAVFAGLWAYRINEVDEIGRYIYTIGLIFVIVSIIWDRRIHRFFEYRRFNEIQDYQRNNLRKQTLREINQLRKDFADGVIQDKSDFKRELKILQDKYHSLSE